MTSPGFTEMMKLNIDGEPFTVLTPDVPMQVRSSSPVKVAMVADTVEELLTPDAYTQACRMLYASVRRRGITPKGNWFIATMPIDWPEWDQHIEPSIAKKIAAKVAEINGHVMVYVLMDTATLQVHL